MKQFSLGEHFFRCSVAMMWNQMCRDEFAENNSDSLLGPLKRFLWASNYHQERKDKHNHIQEKHPKTSNNTKSLLNLLIFFSKRPGICFPINRPERFKPSSSEKSGKSDNNCPRKSHSPKPATFHGSWLWTVGMVAWWVGYTKTVMEKEPFPTGKTSRVKNLFILACWFTSL